MLLFVFVWNLWRAKTQSKTEHRQSVKNLNLPDIAKEMSSQKATLLKIVVANHRLDAAVCLDDEQRQQGVQSLCLFCRSRPLGDIGNEWMMAA
jgi:hypothetical protein